VRHQRRTIGSSSGIGQQRQRPQRLGGGVVERRLVHQSATSGAATEDELLVAQGLGVQAAAPGRHGAHDQLEPTAGQLREQLLSQA
jgi:hypothetical protein